MAKILIVDDEKAIVRALSLKLSHVGFTVSTAVNGAEAWEKLQKDSFDLILLDLVMPDQDGFSLLTALKEKANTTKIIVLSNLTQEEDIQKAKDLGATEYFIKSNISLASLIEYIKKILTV
ncbi:MAG: response regulator [Candidatus Abawacabacteria bacterium]|nr:response regulator [Candidatus Abawacabacteria bacterium]